MKPTLLTNVTLLVGNEFQRVNDSYCLIENGIIRNFGHKQPEIPPDTVTLDCEGLLAIPGLIDAHTHIGDSVAKDIGVGKTLDELVHPLHGLKTQLLAQESPDRLQEGMLHTVSDMLSCGITTFADFREGGLHGIQLAKEALAKSKLRILLLGRPNLVYSEADVTEEMALSTSTMKQLKDTIAICNGIGLSGANEYTTVALQQIANLARNADKLLVIHACESPDAVRFSNENFHASEIERILELATPNAIVHATHVSPNDIQQIAKKQVGVICCPRANATLGVGFPPITALLNHGVKVALGTDNVMLNSTDMFREMDYTARMVKSNSLNPSAVTSTDILRMATANAAEILGLGSTIGTLDVGKRADITFLDLTSSNLRFSQDLASCVVHRARPDDIACVMIDGEIVYGSLKK